MNALASLNWRRLWDTMRPHAQVYSTPHERWNCDGEGQAICFDWQGLGFNLTVVVGTTPRADV